MLVFIWPKDSGKLRLRPIVFGQNHKAAQQTNNSRGPNNAKPRRFTYHDKKNGPATSFTFTDCVNHRLWCRRRQHRPKAPGKLCQGAEEGTGGVSSIKSRMESKCLTISQPKFHNYLLRVAQLCSRQSIIELSPRCLLPLGLFNERHSENIYVQPLTECFHLPCF